MTGTVIDCFEIKDQVALEYGAAGVVVIVKTSSDGETPRNGDPIVLVRNDGWLYQGKAEDVRASEAAPTGLFLRGLTKSDVPIGAELRWGTEIWPRVNAVA